MEIPDDVKARLDPTMQFELLDRAEMGGATYWFIDQFDDFSGDMVIVRAPPGEEPVVVDGLTATFRSTHGQALSPVLQQRLSVYFGDPDDDTDMTGDRGAEREDPSEMPGDERFTHGDPGAQGRLNSRFHNKAVRSAGIIAEAERLISRDPNAPGTNNGRLACAWAVNRVARDGLGQAIGGGLATAELVKVLAAKHSQQPQPGPGSVVISPSVTRPDGRRNIGHVGIVGLPVDGQVCIYSNSSSRGEFQRNWTLAKWRDYYGRGKGLDVRFYALAPQHFPELVS